MKITERAMNTIMNVLADGHNCLYISNLTISGSVEDDYAIEYTDNNNYRHHIDFITFSREVKVIFGVYDERKNLRWAGTLNVTDMTLNAVLFVLGHKIPEVMAWVNDYLIEEDWQKYHADEQAEPEQAEPIETDTINFTAHEPITARTAKYTHREYMENRKVKKVGEMGIVYEFDGHTIEQTYTDRGKAYCNITIDCKPVVTCCSSIGICERIVRELNYLYGLS